MIPGHGKAEALNSWEFKEMQECEIHTTSQALALAQPPFSGEAGHLHWVRHPTGAKHGK
jgi:hypothetical protein